MWVFDDGRQEVDVVGVLCVYFVWTRVFVVGYGLVLFGADVRSTMVFMGRALHCAL